MTNQMPQPLSNVPVTVIPGDGIGPEVVAATVRLVDTAGGAIDWQWAEAGAEVFAKGVSSGVPMETIESINRTRLALKGPLATPVGFGEKSANVTLRKLFETYVNIRPVRELIGVPTPFSGRGIDIVIVRENVEDLYAGIEHMQTPDVAQCLKLISRLGCRRISLAALEFARSEGRSKVSVATKANIMKFTEGMLQREFLDASRNYPDIEARHIIVDNCAHQLVMAPEQFDVIVTSNMNGDILSDLTSGLTGGLGFAPSANLGTDVAIFEAVHGSAPEIAGKDVANPTAMIFSAVMLLRYIGQVEAAEKLEQAVFKTLEDGIHTQDVKGETSVRLSEYVDGITARLGQVSSTPSRRVQPLKLPEITREEARCEPGSRTKVGVDIFIESSDDPTTLANSLQALITGLPYSLKMVSNRGTVVWPKTGGSTSCIDHFRCRFMISDCSSWNPESVLSLLQAIGRSHRWMHVEKLEFIDNDLGYTMAQGEN